MKRTATRQIKLDHATEAIEAIYGDDKVLKEVTIQDLQELVDYIEGLIGSLRILS